MSWYDGTQVHKFVAHNKRVIAIAKRLGWLPAAKYTNLRDIREFDRVGFIDIDWRNYNFERHLNAVPEFKPLMTVARDLMDKQDLPETLDQAYELAEYATYVIIVPKDPAFARDMNVIVPPEFILGFSVPTRYGSTAIPPEAFKRPVHLLGGRPDVQRRLAELIPVTSIDCNRFTLDAAYGDYFDGNSFRPHPRGGYDRCIMESIRNIDTLWDSYDWRRILRKSHASPWQR